MLLRVTKDLVLVRDGWDRLVLINLHEVFNDVGMVS